MTNNKLIVWTTVRHLFRKYAAYNFQAIAPFCPTDQPCRPGLVVPGRIVDSARSVDEAAFS